MDKVKIRKKLEHHPRLFKPYIFLANRKQNILHLKDTVTYGSRSPKHFYIDYDKKVIYIRTAKCGCSSIRNSMGYDGKEETIRDTISYDTGKYIKHRLTPTESDFYIFSFVRNPFDRLVSLYENQYNGNPLRYLDTNRASIYIMYNKGFEYFIWEVLSSTKWNMDTHYKTLYDELYTDGLHRTLIPDYVGRFENFEEDFKVLSDRFGFKPLPKLNPSQRGDWRDYYTLKTAERVYQKFEKDFHTFGYDDCYDELQKYIKKKRRDA